MFRILSSLHIIYETVSSRDHVLITTSLWEGNTAEKEGRSEGEMYNGRRIDSIESAMSLVALDKQN